MEKKGLVKKAIKRTLKIAGVTMLSGAVVAATFVAAKEIQYKDKNYQLNYLKDACGVENLNLFSRLSMMYDQPTEPIKYYYDEDYATLCGDATIKVLDKVYGYIAEINPNYSYEFVESKADANIVYKLSQLEKNYRALCHMNQFDSYIGKNTIEIRVDYDQIVKECPNKSELPAQIEATILHETMHTFGLKDLYDSDKLYLNNIMSAKVGEENTISSNYGESVEIKANDYCELSIAEFANLLINMAPVVKEEELPQLAKTINSKIKEHEEKLMAKVNLATNAYEHQKIDDKIIFDTPIFCRKHGKKIIESETASRIIKSQENLNISITGSHYKLKLDLENGGAEECEGKVERLENNVVVLRNVKTHFRLLGNEKESYDAIIYDAVLVKVNDEYLMFTDYNRPVPTRLIELTNENKPDLSF